MASNAETIQNLKNSLVSLKDNPNAQKALTKFQEQRAKLFEFVRKYKTPVIVSVVIVVILSVYLFVFYNRVDRSLRRMKDYDLSKVTALQYNRKVMSGNFKLCDFYVASSYKSYLPCTNYYDYASCESIKQVIKAGARYIDLDIYNKDFEMIEY